MRSTTRSETQLMADANLAGRRQQISNATKIAQGFPRLGQPAELNMNFDGEISLLQDEVYSERENLKRMEKLYAQIQAQKHVKPASWLGQLQRQTSQRLKAMMAAHPVGVHKILHAAKASMLYFRLIVIGGLLRITEISSGGPQVNSAQDRNQKAAIYSLREDIKNSTLRLRSLKDKTDSVIRLETRAIDYAIKIKEQLAQITQAQETCEALRQQVMLKQDKVDTYKELPEKSNCICAQ